MPNARASGTQRTAATLVATLLLAALIIPGCRAAPGEEIPTIVYMYVTNQDDDTVT